ncbi:MAG: hypothetical protein IPK17_39455, partial [Chloroflexi bacterium]|uniref:hypothetical protein n=1 Tax=Candidatus Flexifilum breve TaxID=3140694 RepID=UPI0031364A4F|nr:hypothetical protein [Chloroflexota bacterium]
MRVRNLSGFRAKDARRKREVAVRRRWLWCRPMARVTTPDEGLLALPALYRDKVYTYRQTTD